MATSLQELSSLNPNRVLRCGRLKQLGPNGIDRLGRLLEQHFGPVTRILPTTLPTNGTQGSLAFAVMESEDQAQEVLRLASTFPPLAGLCIRQFDGQ